MAPTMSPDLELLLSKIVTRRDFSAWLKDLLDNNPSDIAEARADQDLLYDYAKDYTREMGIEYNEGLGLFDFMDKRSAAKVLSGLPVAVYHGTSSALLPSILRAGGLRRPRPLAALFASLPYGARILTRSFTRPLTASSLAAKGH